MISKQATAKSCTLILSILIWKHIRSKILHTFSKVANVLFFLEIISKIHTSIFYLQITWLPLTLKEVYPCQYFLLSSECIKLLIMISLLWMRSCSWIYSVEPPFICFKFTYDQLPIENSVMSWSGLFFMILSGTKILVFNIGILFIFSFVEIEFELSF